MLPRPTISVPTPCPATWADMTPAPGGRHCAACNKVVVDFTRMTEAEILAALGHPGSVCGRFRAEQLGTSSRLRIAAAGWLAAAVALSGCEVPDPAQVRLRTAPNVAANSSFQVRGHVLDKTTGQPVAGAYIVCSADSTLHTKTATDGSFELQLPTALRDSLLTISGGLPHYDAEVPFEYFGRRIPAANAAVIRLRRYDIPMMLGEVPDPKLEQDEVSLPAPPPPKLSTIVFTAPINRADPDSE
jgi:hypothetical protein